MKIRLEGGGDPDLPFLEPAFSHFIAYLFDAGPTSVGGMGMVPLTWTDLRAWELAVGVSLPPWQLRLLRQLSREYITEAIQADEHDAPPPWEREVDRVRIAKHIRNVIRGGG